MTRSRGVKRSLDENVISSPPPRRKRTARRSVSNAQRHGVPPETAAQAQSFSESSANVNEEPNNEILTLSLRSHGATTSAAVIPELPREVTVEQCFSTLNTTHRRTSPDTQSVNDHGHGERCGAASSESMDSFDNSRDEILGCTTEGNLVDNIPPPLVTPNQVHASSSVWSKAFRFLTRLLWFLVRMVGVAMVGAVGAHAIMLGFHGPEWYNCHRHTQEAQAEIMRLRGELRNREEVADISRSEFEQEMWRLQNDLSQQQENFKECNRQLDTERKQTLLLQTDLVSQKDLNVGCHGIVEEEREEISGLRQQLAQQGASAAQCHNDLHVALDEINRLQDELNRQQEAAVDALDVIGTMSAVRFRKAERQVDKLQKELSRQQEAAINAINSVALAVASKPDEEEEVGER